MADPGTPTIHVVLAADVRPLRTEVLRVGMPDATVEFDGDEDPETFHLAMRDGTGDIVAVSTWMPRACPDEPHRRSIQLRGMATRHGLQGSGLGGLLIRAGVEEARQRTVEAIWANARDTALTFYERHGFLVVGDGFIEPVTRLPHHRVLRPV